jgi:hypothetical protein
LETFNQGFMVHLAPRLRQGSGGLTPVAEHPCEWRAGTSGARCGLKLPASKTGTLSVAVVARHVVMRTEALGTLAAVFSRMARRYSHASVVHRSRMP